MYNILIAEDEAIERNVIKCLIDQYHFDLHIFESDNGETAYDLLRNEQIDILLTDIQMPLMDGLELADKAKQLYPDISIIFFSSHDDFSYIKKALSLRAADYIMKPIDPDEFCSTLSNVLDNIRNQEAMLLERQNRLHIIQNHILYKLINKTSVEHLRFLYPQADLSFIYDCRRLILIQMDRDYFGVIPAENETYISSSELKHRLPPDSHFINLNPAQNILLLTGPNHHNSWYEALAGKVSDYIQNTCRISCHTAISSVFYSPEEISVAYEEAERKLMDTLSISHSASCPTDSPLMLSESPLSDDAILDQIRSDIQFKDSIGLRSHVRLLTDTLKNNPNYSHIYFRFLCTSVLKILLDGFSPEKKKRFDDYASIISHSVHLAPIESLLLSLADELATSFENENESPLQTLRQVKQYIREHYAEDLSLEILAKKVYLTPNYLSRLFTEHNGHGINKYIKKVRMEKAQYLLLNTNLPVNEISKQVGYSSNSYFCTSFLKDFEVSPDKFRNENRISSERKES